MRKSILLLALAAIVASCATTKDKNGNNITTADKNGYWQQHVDYTMDVNIDVESFGFDGTQTLVYTNNSPETLDRVFYHLYFNAFQPGSQMDVRSQTIKDPDPRVGKRISHLSESETGQLHVSNMTQDGKTLNPKEEETILVVPLADPLKPGESTTLKLDFNGQVPVQIRRSGRDNEEGVALSMSQWYPKIAEYDKKGWHATPYVGREFHGVWGDFDVTINIDKDYVLGGSGYLQNPQEIGYNYEQEGQSVNRPAGDKLSWHFKAPMVHDFTWAADPDYTHDKMEAYDGTMLHFLYKNSPNLSDNWKKLQLRTEDLLRYYNNHIGPYPYKQYSVIQGGDGGMEYAMCTLITGDRKFGSLFGVTAHEMAHAWFQHILATDEAKNEWMDEGFTTYISTLAEDEISGQNSDNPNARNYQGYIYLANSGNEQPQTTYADRYRYNQSYGLSAYSKGAVFMAQLGYIVGDDVRDRIIKEYFNEWKFKHPTPNDFIRVAERVSGFNLQWYLTDWTQTTNQIDYAVEDVQKNGNSTTITLARKKMMPMPLDVQVTLQDGSTQMYYIPLEDMRNEKETPSSWKTRKDWPWAYPSYDLTLDMPMDQIKSITIDPEEQMADVNRDNNSKSL